MKNTFVLGSLFLSSLATAIPMVKRDYITETVTEEFYETVVITTTVWVEPTPVAVAAATSSPAAFYEHSKSPIHHKPSAYTPPPAPPSSSSSAAPVAPPSTPAYTPPAVATPAYTPPPASTPAYTPPPASTPSSTPSSSGSQYSGTGDLTWYDTGVGSCGLTSGPNDKIVALSHIIMDKLNPGNPNNNPLCGKSITINFGGETHTATVVDTCEGCAEGDLDLSHGFFNLVTNYGDGRVHGATWSIA